MGRAGPQGRRTETPARCGQIQGEKNESGIAVKKKRWYCFVCPSGRQLMFWLTNVVDKERKTRIHRERKVVVKGCGGMSYIERLGLGNEVC